MSFWRSHPILGAALLYVLLTIALSGHALVGRGTMAPEAAIDSEALFKTLPPSPPNQLVNDYAAILLDLPRDLRLARAMHQGRFEAWNPLAACGAPLWAEQGGPFFPLKLAYYLVPNDVGYNWFRALRLFFSALGAFLLARRRGLSFEGSLLAGALFEVSGVVIGWTPFGNAGALCMLPWVILGAQAIVDRSDGRAAIGAGLALGLTGSSGHPSLAMMTFLSFAVALAGHTIARPRRILVHLKLGALAGAIGLLIAAPTLLPLIELYQNGATYKNSLSGEAIWQTALRDLNPTIAAAQLVPKVLLELRPQLGNLYPHAFTSSIGVLGTMLAISGLLRRRIDGGLLAMMVVGVGLAVSPPGMGWLHHLPGVRFVLPHYCWPMLVLPATQLAGSGLPRAGEMRRWIPAIGVAALCVALFFWRRHLQPYNNWSFDGLMKRSANVPHLRFDIYAPYVAGATIALAWLALARTRAARVVTVLAAVLSFAEAFHTMSPFLHDVRSAALTRSPSPAVRFLQSRTRDGLSRFAAVPYNIATPHAPMLFGLPDFRGDAPMPVARFAKYRELIDTRQPYPTFQTIERTASSLLDLAAVRWIVVPRSKFKHEVPTELDDDESLPRVYADGQVVIFENTWALPRAFLSHKTVVRPNAYMAAQSLWDRARGARHVNETTLLQELIIDPNPYGERPADLDGPTVGADEWVRITDGTRSERVVMEASLDSPGFVVLADTFYPGWEATVDGKRTPIFPADVDFRAVYVDAGKHKIVYTYQPEQMRLGLALMILTLLLCFAWWREHAR